MHNIDTTYCKPANLIPHFWFHKVIDKDGRPDLPCIILLSEIFGWFRKDAKSKKYYSRKKSLPELVDGELAITYEYLMEKLHLPRERIRKSFVKLEKLGLLVRCVRNVILENGTRNNRLFITFDENFLASCFYNPKIDIRVHEGEAIVINSDDIKDTLSTRDGGNLICNKNKRNKNRSIRSKKSNFLKNYSKGSINPKPSVVSLQYNANGQKNGKEQHYQCKAGKSRVQANSPRKLKDFYPLTKKDCRILQSLSGREFSLNAMNEILKDMSGRVSDRFFYSKKGFFAYMSKVFMHEMRDSVRISNENFKIRSNQNTSKREIQKQERYLAEIENFLQVSPEWHLKKKLASVLARGKAYNVLTAYRIWK